MRSWRLEYERVCRENSSLTSEIRNLRCAMVEAAGSINPTHEPELFKHLIGAPGYFVDDRSNPYPEHVSHVSDQYIRELLTMSESFGGSGNGPGNDQSANQEREQREDGEL